MENVKISKPVSFAHIDVDTYVSAKESLEFLLANSISGAVIILDDYGGWFTDGITKLGNELKLEGKLICCSKSSGPINYF